MNNLNKKEKKVNYDRIVKIVKEAEKEALKFIKHNSTLDPQLQPRYR